jgi:SAM-dependent methyltransferase
MEFRPLLSDEAIIEEIALLTNLERHDIERRVHAEKAANGSNVCRDAETFGVSPHVYDERMERLYEQGDGFIFETLVFWAKPGRQQWTLEAIERIRRYSQNRQLKPHQVRILMLGDGTGSDSLFLVSQGFHVDYFDFPGSKTFAFTRSRFERYGVLDRGANLITRRSEIRSNHYDVVFCFEVLEHLPDPVSLIDDIGKYLRAGGIALITEAFRNVSAMLPTHLECNRRLDGKTVFLFLRQGLMLDWYSPSTLFKPTEYLKKNRISVGCLVKLLMDWGVMKMFVGGRLRNLRVIANRLLHGLH